MAKITKLPDGVTLETLKSNWDLASQSYQRAFRRIRMLDATDRGKLWEAINAKFPAYQLLPDTNHVAYVKTNILASIYTVGKSASIIPTSREDKDAVNDVNMTLDNHWELAKTGYYQMLAGDRAALCNLGITQIGWDQNLSGGDSDVSAKGRVVYKNVDPLKFMRDPYADSLETSAYCMTWDELHKNVLKSNPLYKETLDKAINDFQTTVSVPAELIHDGPTSSEKNSQRDYYKLIIHWVRIGDDYYEIHTLDNAAVLHIIKLLPAAFPFALLYCNLPAGDLIGTSEPAKIFANSVAYNLTNSVLLTGEYKNQRPPKFISNMSGLNVSSFVKHGNEADYTFVVNGPANNAVHYHQFPMPSVMAGTIMGNLRNDIAQVSGVDARYTGRDTGSVQTTGGIESLLDAATLIDTPKIANYEQYTCRLTQLTLLTMIEFAPKRTYMIKDKKSTNFVDVTIDFPSMKKETLFQYALNISSELPKNKARIAQTASTLMEKQMQYAQMGGKSVDLFTPEEWLMCQDLPNKEYMQERMGIQRNQDYVAQVSEILFSFTGLVKNGVPTEEAIQMTAQSLQNRNTPGMQEEPPAYMEGPPEPAPQTPMMPEQMTSLQPDVPMY